MLDQDSLFIHFLLHVKACDKVREEIERKKAEQKNGSHGA